MYLANLPQKALCCSIQQLPPDFLHVVLYLDTGKCTLPNPMESDADTNMLQNCLSILGDEGAF